MRSPAARPEGPHEPAGPQKSEGVLGRSAPLVGLLCCALLLHLVAALRLPTPRIWGDENHYLAFALLDDLQGTTAPLPGTLRFGHRPELGPRVDSLVLDVAAETPRPSDEAAAVLAADLMGGARFPELFHRLEGLRIGLALLLGLLTWGLALGLGASRRGAAIASAGVLFFPPLFFHAHALWAELLHACLLQAALLALVRGGAPMPACESAADRCPARLGAFLVAGVLLGFSLLAKGTLVPFLPMLVLALLLPIERLLRHRKAQPASDATRDPEPTLRVARAFALVAGISLVVLPQVFANRSAAHGARLAANRWWNLELGLADSGDLDPARLEAARARGLTEPEERLLPVQRASRIYFDAAADPLGRERLARSRTLKRLSERGLPRILLGQLRKLAGLLAAPDWSLDQSLTFRQRWGPDFAPAPGLRSLVRLLWWALLAGGLAGLFRRGLRPETSVPALLLVVFFAALLLVPFKARFLIPLVPLLSLFLGLALDTRESALTPALLSDSPRSDD